ncbi:MAG: hypothetical protein R3320_13415, partial [Nitriliruptorales bacterium]|nr:hypothetical protein [Nitriliruptorales bacterium]
MIRDLVEQAFRLARRGAVTTTGAWIVVLQRINQALDGGPVSDPTIVELRRMLGLRPVEEDQQEDVPNGARAKERLSDVELRDRFGELLARS